MKFAEAPERDNARLGRITRELGASAEIIVCSKENGERPRLLSPFSAPCPILQDRDNDARTVEEHSAPANC